MEFFLEYFGFEKDPFENSYDLDLYYISTVHRKALAKLYRAGIEEGITCLIGDFGTGKTFSVKKFISELKETKAVYIDQYFSSFDNLLDYIIESLDLVPKDNSLDELLSLLKEYSESKRLIIVIDDAHKLSLNVLNDLKLLLVSSDNIKLVLVGDTKLETILNLSGLQLLKQKITSTAKLKNLNKKDTKKYIDAKIFSAGSLKLKVASSAYKLIHKITKGNPYMINLLMEEALYIAFKKKKKKISKSYVKKAAKHLKLKYKKRSILTYLIWLTVVVLASIIVYSTDLFNLEEFIPMEKIFGKTEKPVETAPKPQKKENLNPPPAPKKEEVESYTPEEPIKLTKDVSEELEEEPIFKETKKENPIIGKKAVVDIAFINLREKPDTKSRILAVIPENYEVRILEDNGTGWVKVSYFSKRQNKEFIGWIKKKYLKIKEAE